MANQAARLVSLRQHRMLAQLPRDAALAQSTSFLAQELPLRLDVLRSAAGVLPAGSATLPAVQAWDSALAGLARPGAAPEPAELAQQAGHALGECHLRLEHLGADLQLWLSSCDWDPSHQRRVDAFFSRAHYLLIGLRLVAASQARVSGSGEAGAEDAAVTEVCEVEGVIRHSVEDARAFAREKYGCVPDVDVVVPPGAEHKALVVPSWVAFITHEILKNSMTAHNRRYGIDADLGPEVSIRIGRQAAGRQLLEVSLEDCGPGMDASQLAQASSWLRTQVEVEGGAVSRRLDGNEHWKYTRLMGAQFSGLGVGLPLARVYSWLMGGDLTVHSTPGQGTTVELTIDPHGDTPWVPAAARLGAAELLPHEGPG